MDFIPFKHVSMTTILLFLLIIITTLQNATAATPTVVKAAYWFPQRAFPATSINSSLFTHLFCAFLDLDPVTSLATISPANSADFSSFTRTVQLRNPNVKTLLSIGGGNSNASTFAHMARRSHRRKAFIDSSIAIARSNGFHGLDLDWESPATKAEMANFGLAPHRVEDRRHQGRSPEEPPGAASHRGGVLLFRPLFRRPSSQKDVGQPGLDQHNGL